MEILLNDDATDLIDRSLIIGDLVPKRYLHYGQYYPKMLIHQVNSTLPLLRLCVKSAQNASYDFLKAGCYRVFGLGVILLCQGEWQELRLNGVVFDLVR